MAYTLDAGALRTRIMVFDLPEEEAAYDADGYPGGSRRNVFGEGRSICCRWINLHGAEVFTARQSGVEEGATLTLRYSPKIKNTCEIYRGADPAPYEVISVNDIEDRHAWLEIKVRRKAQGRAEAGYGAER